MSRFKIPGDKVIRDYAQQFAKTLTRLANLGPGVEFDRLASAHFRARRQADLVALVKNAAGEKTAVHIELQSRRDPAFPGRMLEYNTLVGRREKCPVVSIAIYLTPRASASGRGGSLSFGTHLTQGLFTWLEIHAHQLSLDDEQVRALPGLLPLVVAAARDVTPKGIVEAVDKLRGALGGDDARRELLVTLEAFAKVRFGLESSLWPREKETEMEHIYALSPIVQNVSRKARLEGLAEGRTAGRAEGKLAMLKSMVEALGATWYPGYSEAGAKLSDAVVADLIIKASRKRDRGTLQRMLDEILGGEVKPNGRTRAPKAV